MGEKTKTLTVTASNGVRKFSEKAYPYNENTRYEQFKICVDSIHQQMKEAGVYEACESYVFTDSIS